MSGLIRAAMAFGFSMAFALAAPSARAQGSAYDPNRYLTEKAVGEIHDILRKTLPPGPALSVADARKILTSAVLSALAKSCGMQWDRQIYLPMMAYFRHSRKLAEPQMAVLGMVHGIYQGFTLKELAQGDCPRAVRDQISRGTSGSS